MKYRFIAFLLGFGFLLISTGKRPASVDTSDMVLVKGGNFLYGLDSVQLKNLENRFNKPASYFEDESMPRRVTVATFYIDKYEVTNRQFKKFIDANPQWSKSIISDSLQNGDYLKDWKNNNYPKGKGDYPVVYVSWYAANAYAHWVGKRLPIEVEWQYASKELNGSKAFTFGNVEAYPISLSTQSKTSFPEPVGKHEPNSLGLFDMYNNVSEFCLDHWRKYERFDRPIVGSIYQSNDRQKQPSDRNAIVVCGGNFKSEPVDLRITRRIRVDIIDCQPTIGFRCAATYIAKPR